MSVGSFSLLLTPLRDVASPASPSFPLSFSFLFFSSLPFQREPVRPVPHGADHASACRYFSFSLFLFLRSVFCLPAAVAATIRQQLARLFGLHVMGRSEDRRLAGNRRVSSRSRIAEHNTSVMTGVPQSPQYTDVAAATAAAGTHNLVSPVAMSGRVSALAVYSEPLKHRLPPRNCCGTRENDCTALRERRQTSLPLNTRLYDVYVRYVFPLNLFAEIYRRT